MKNNNDNMDSQKVGGSNRTPLRLPQSYRDVILDAITDGVFTVDLDFTITFFNRAAEVITGVLREEAIGAKCFDVFHADTCQGKCVIRRTLDSGRPVVDERVEIINSGGENVPIRVSTGILRDENGGIIGGVETFRDISDIERLRKELTGKYRFEDIISRSPSMQRIFAILPDLATSDSTILIEGPSGTGKELVARAIHNIGARREHPFIAVNCGALPDTLLESELFGYRQGAFTGAVRDKPGRFTLAGEGTIFLDEIGEISPAMQVKLLRVLQEKRFEPLGGTETLETKSRVIAATNKNLAEQVSKGEFRADLYYRLNVVRITLPNLRARREDIPLLIEHFILRFHARTGKRITGISPAALDILMRYDYPGNIRELENIIEHAFVMCRGPLVDTACLPPEVVPASSGTESEPESVAALPEAAEAGPLRHAEAQAVIRALRIHGGDRARTAEYLGIHKTTLWRKMKKYGITGEYRRGTTGS